ncbi:flavin reductase family protein [Oceanobacter sp. 3_MG-2023]|uniref:flavin reductase family protein n=1 Tax=Oceanobacter sp. 3_MG-2023 TaxID=3062622 RepID=UPI0027333527|nr:flavin reductase family protein [Oceanobacter sp. 3_MG-2023]MDP2505535.1 flavin reductase family protein [Oceanobacter sp. 3_MG-2023]
MISNELFCNTMRQLASGVAVITMENDGQLHAMTATSFTSVSAQPPLALVCIKRGSDTDQLLGKAERMGVSLLSESQQEISNRYAWKTADPGRFDDLDTRRCPGGALVFNDSAAVMEAVITETYEAGDHTIYIAQLDYAAVNEEVQPLLYWQGRYAGLDSPA